ncbi:MAG: hypothetical protein LBG80_00975 [Bacteroidales bacterium]|jgi:hypothetical protein|nr:hypothetical protein [Bacteroidales bacterium]
MKSFRIIILFLSIIGLIIVGLIYLKYRKEIVFSPNVFFTELLKFLAFTIFWTILLELYRKSGSEKKNRSLKELLLISKSKELLIKLNTNSLSENELSLGVALIINNISLIRSYPGIAPVLLKQLSDFENRIKEKDFIDAIRYIEFDVKNKNSYNRTHLNLIINEIETFISCILR